MAIRPSPADAPATSATTTEVFSAITESRQLAMPDVELQMLFDRYAFVREHAAGRTVIEVGCGQGLGAPLVARVAERAMFADLLHSNVSKLETDDGQLRLCCGADVLPLPDGSVDVVAALEMLYYMPSLTGFITECCRVLRPGGELLMTLPNSSRPGFHRSPFSTDYPTVSQLHELLRINGLAPQVFGVFELSQSAKARTIRSVATVAERLHLIPRSLEARARIKRFVQGRLQPFPGIDEVERRFATSSDPRQLLGDDSPNYSMLYVIGRKGTQP